MSIEKRARDFAVHVSLDELNKEGLDAESFCGILHGYIQGATDQRKIDIDKACEWLKENVNNYLYNTGGFEEYIPQCGSGMFIDFRKAMEDKL